MEIQKLNEIIQKQDTEINKLKDVIDRIKYINENNKPHKAQAKIRAYLQSNKQI